MKRHDKSAALCARDKAFLAFYLFLFIAVYSVSSTRGGSLQTITGTGGSGSGSNSVAVGVNNGATTNVSAINVVGAGGTTVTGGALGTTFTVTATSSNSLPAVQNQSVPVVVTATTFNYDRNFAVTESPANTAKVALADSLNVTQLTVTSNVTLPSLTTNRILYIGTGGLVTVSNLLQFNGTTFSSDNIATLILQATGNVTSPTLAATTIPDFAAVYAAADGTLLGATVGTSNRVLTDQGAGVAPVFTAKTIYVDVGYGTPPQVETLRLIAGTNVTMDSSLNGATRNVTINATGGGGFSGDIDSTTAKWLYTTSTTTPSVMIVDDQGVFLGPSSGASYPTQGVSITSWSNNGVTFSGPAAGVGHTYTFTNHRTSGQQTLSVVNGSSGGSISLVSNGTVSGNADIQVSPSGGAAAYFASNSMFIGGSTSPTARAHIAASSTSRASTRVVAGTAPTSPNDGDGWHDSTQLCDIVRRAGINQRVPGVLFTTTSDVTSTTPDPLNTNFISALGPSTGVTQTGANGWAPGKTLRLQGTLKLNGDAVTPGNALVQIRLGSSVLGQATLAIPASATYAVCGGRFQADVTCVSTGATGQFRCSGALFISSLPAGNNTREARITTVDGTTTREVDTTAAKTIDVMMKVDTADTDNGIACEFVSGEFLN